MRLHSRAVTNEANVFRYDLAPALLIESDDPLDVEQVEKARNELGRELESIRYRRGEDRMPKRRKALESFASKRDWRVVPEPAPRPPKIAVDLEAFMRMPEDVRGKLLG